MSGATFAFVALAAACAVWLVAGTAMRVMLRPRRPRPGPATSDLRDEPPAVVNLLTHDWCVTSSAAAATVVDLAQRGYVDIVQVSPEQDVVELRSTTRDRRALEPYERQVLDHLRRTAVGGVVPARALTTGPTAASDRWWARFRRGVEKDARDRALSRNAYPPLVLGIFGATLALLVLWLYLAVSATRDAAPGDGPAAWTVVVAVALVAVCLVAARRFDRYRQRDTPAGLAAATHWLGVRKGYTEVGSYDELPPAAVVLYERHLAYAAAMDAARRTVERLPLSAEDDRLAWSSHGGRWRQVRVHYPSRRVGWGEGPGHAIVGGLLWTLALAIPVGYLAIVGTDVRERLEDAARSVGQVTDPANRLYDDVAAQRIALGLTWAIALVLVAITVLALRRGVLRLARGLVDAGREQFVRGTVVRRRTWPRQRGTETVHVDWIAVDDGSSDELRAYAMRPTVAASLAQGDQVELEVTPYLGFVRTARVVVPAPELPPVRPVAELPGPKTLPPVHWLEEMQNGNGHAANGGPADAGPRRWLRFTTGRR